MSDRNRELTKTRLLDAAEQLFAARGYDGVGLREVATKAAANVSLISRYFGGKQGLLLALTERFRSRKEGVTLAYPAQSDLAAELEAYLRFRYEEDQLHAGVIRLIVSRILVDDGFRHRMAQVRSAGAEEEFMARLHQLQRTGAISAEVDLEDLFADVSLFSFGCNFVRGLLLAVDRETLFRQFAHFATTYAAGLASRE